MDGFAMVNCDLGGTAIGLLWEIPLQRTEIIGAIGLRNSSFEACRLRGVGFAGHPEGIWRIIAGTTRSD